MWNRRQCTKFNGTPYIIQYAGAKVFTEEGMKECQENIGYYLENAQVVGTPGAGFGENGKNYFRLTSFGKHEKTKEAMERFNSLF